MSMSLPSTLEWKLQMCVHTTFFPSFFFSLIQQVFCDTCTVCAGCEWVHDGGACHWHVTPTHCIMSSAAGCSARSGNLCRLSGNGQSAGAVGAFSVLSLFMPDTVIMILWQWHTDNTNKQTNMQTTVCSPPPPPFLLLLLLYPANPLSQSYSLSSIPDMPHACCTHVLDRTLCEYNSTNYI